MLTLAACASYTPPMMEAPWPDDIPERAWFEARYAADADNQAHQRRADYLRWVTRFYHGWVGYPNGWVRVSAQVSAAVDPAARTEVERRMWLLGRRVGAEWARDRTVSLIGDDAVAAWLHVLPRAAAAGDISASLEHVAADVDALFAGTLDTAAVDVTRYEPGAPPPLRIAR
ncbi:MAG: hypothetical protein ACU85V_15760 [Gammaproteobacteria bacterium]